MNLRSFGSGAAGAALAAALFVSGACGQTLLQAGPSTPGHVPQYINQGSQPVVMDGGGSGGGILNTNPGEAGITSRNPSGTYPAIGTGNGPLGEHFCMYDGPTNNAAGYHYLCLDPNGTGSHGIIDYGAAGTATPQGLLFMINGTPIGNLTSVTIGTTVVGGGSDGYALYDNGGILGAFKLGSGVMANLGNDPGNPASFVVNGGPLGTPTSGTMTNMTGTPASLGLANATGTPASLILTNAIGTPAAINLTNASAMPPSALISGVGVPTALGINVGTAGSFVVNGGALGTPSSGTLSSVTGLPISTGVSGLGTGAATALGVNVGSAGSLVVNGGALGTPSSGTLTSVTGLPISTGVSGLGTGVATAAGNAANGASGLVVKNASALIVGAYGPVALAFSATAPTFTSGACVGAIGSSNGSAAFTFTTGSGSCGSTATLGLPLATNGWVCDAFDEAIVGTARIQQSASSSSSVVLTSYSIGSSPAATNYTASHTVKVKCSAY